MKYTPHNWVVVTVPEGHKLIGGWSGGYLDGDSWRINSGISRVEDMEDHYLVHGVSGSLYHCHKGGEEIRMNLMAPLERIKRAGFNVVEMGSILGEYTRREDDE